MYDSNLPPQLSSDSSFLNEGEPKMKECNKCCGKGILTYIIWDMEGMCSICNGTGQIEMTPDEIREEIERNKEDKSNL